MALHFSRAEFAERSTRVRAAMAERGLDALLMFHPRGFKLRFPELH